MKDDASLDELLADRPPEEPWLVSYADLLTLLLGFFVLLLAVSTIKAPRFEALAAAMSGSKRPAPLEVLRADVEQLVAREHLEGKLQAREDADGLGIEFKEALLFTSGSADVQPAGQEALAAVARFLSRVPERRLVVEGYTDDVPIRTAAYRSNWDLSAQRAIHVLGVLEAAGVARERLSVRGYADTRPVEAQGTLEQRRAANRRVVLRVQ